MTATTVKSTLITNLETVPLATSASPKDFYGIERISCATVEVATTSIDETNDRILMVPVPMEARVLGIYIHNDKLDSHSTVALTADIGLWYGQGCSQTPGTLIDDDAYAVALTTLQAATTAATAGYNYAFHTKDHAKITNHVWEDGALTSNPGGTAYIGISVETAAATAAAGTLTMIVKYVVD
jgi:hypothetical protein